MVDFIEHIFYINLDYREDRREEIESELKRMDLLQKSERFSAIACPEQGILGCTKSHMEVLKLAKSRGYKNVLILEDDFEFVIGKEKMEMDLTEFFQSPIGKKYDVCFVTCCLSRESLVSEECSIVRKIVEASNAAGYIVQEKYYDTIIDLFEKVVPLLAETKAHWIYANDQAWKVLQEKDRWYHFVDRFGKQRAGYSDNSYTYMDYE